MGNANARALDSAFLGTAFRLLRPRENAATLRPGAPAPRVHRSVGRLGAVASAAALAVLTVSSPAEAYSRIEPAGADLAADTTTTGEIAVGGELGRATRQTRQDVDWFRVSLTADQTYTVDLLGSNATGCTLIDPVLQGVHDPHGQLIAGTWRGDGGTGLNSRLTFTPARSGVHYVAAAGAFENDYIGTGTYAVAVTAGSTSDDAALRSTGCGGVPSAPSGVDALAGTGNARVRVLWTASSDTTVTGYEVLRGRTVHDMTRIGTVTGRSTSQYDDSGAGWETTYVYGVRAVNANGVSARSETASVTTLQAPPPSARADEGPNADDDAPRGPRTAARVTVDGGSQEGNLNGIYCIPDGTTYETYPGGDYDWWKFDLEAGKTYLVELRGKSTGDGTAENFAVNGIFDPGVTHLGHSYSSGHSAYTNRGDTVSLTFTAMQTGTHHIEVSSLGRFYYAPHSNHDKCTDADPHLALGAPEGDRGTYKIEVTELTSLPPEAASATALTVGTEHEGALRRGEGVRDWYRATLEAGKDYGVSMTQVVRNGKLLRWPTIYGVYDPAGEALPRTRNIGGSSNPSFTPLDSAAAVVRFTPTTAGEHRISVGDASGVSVAIGDAYLDVYPYAIMVGVPPGRVQEMFYTVRGSQTIKLNWDVPTDQGSAPVIGYEYRYAKAEEGESGLHQKPWNTIDTFHVTVPDLDIETLYAVDVRAVNRFGRGPARSRPDFVVDCPTESNPPPYCTAMVGGSVPGYMEFDGIDSWGVTLQEGKTYQIDVKGSDTNDGTLTDPRLFFVNPMNRQLAGDDNSGQGRNARITYTVSPGRGGRYVIDVEPHGQEVGTYTLTVTDITPMSQEEDSTPAAQVTETTDCPAATPTCTFTVGDTVDGALDPASDIDSWLVDLEEGKTYQFGIEGRDGGDGALPDPYVYLYPPTGGNEVASGTGTSVQFTYAAQTGDGGTYTLDVESDAGNTGGYRITVTDITPMMSQDDVPALTVQFAATPLEHDGTTPFAVDVRFSDAIATSAEQMRASVEVTGGSATGAARRDVANQEIWRITVTPAGNADVVVRVPVTSDCSATAAICASGDRGVTNAISTTVLRAAVLAELLEVPKEHDGSSTFTFEVHFSEVPKLSYRTVRDHLFTVGGGNITRARRVTKGSNLAFEVTVEPDGVDDVTLSAAPTSDCAASAAVCTRDARPMHNGLSATVPGPAALSVADTSVREAPGATLDFVVTLNRTRHEATTVDYATSDGTATAASDYTARSGTLTFDAGEDEKTISVPVLDDAIDDDGETVTLTLSNASAATRITDDTAIGTIENSDRMPKAWLVRFGRTVGSQVIDALSDRLDGSSASHVTVGGIELRSGAMPQNDTQPERESLTLTGWDAGAGGEEPERTMTLDDLVKGTRFHLSSGASESGGAAYTAWGRVTSSGFEAEVDDVTLDGDVTSALVGFDAQWDRALAGVMLSQSSGEGGYRLNPAMGDDAGTVKSTLTGVYPYARLALNERVSAWGLAGMGSGELTLRQNEMKDMPSDISMRMGALGVNAAILDAADSGRLALTLKSDAMWVSTKSEASKGDVTRLRLTLQGERPFTLSEERTLTPSAEIGVRHDAGDAEPGAGLEVGAGLRYTAGALTVEGRVRALIAHEETGYEEWGVSGSLQVAPGTGGRGLTLRIAPAWGATGSATERLWGARDAGELGAGAAQFEGEGRIESEVGYGLALSRKRGLVTPYTALSVGEGASRTWRFGARWRASDELTVGLEGTRVDSASDAPTNAVQLRAQLRW